MMRVLFTALFLILMGSPEAFAAGQAPHSLGKTPGDDTPQEDVFDEDTPAPTIQAAPVTQPSIDGFGTLEEGRGGLPVDIWKNSTHEDVSALLQQFNTGIASAPLRDLTIRLLMTQATPPEGNGANWFKARLDALIAIGADDKADAMIASVPISMMNDDLRELHSKLLLARGEWENACKPQNIAQNPPTPAANGLFWRKLLIICQMRAGKKDEAMLALDLMHEASGHDDAFFQEALRRLNNKNAPITSFPKEWSLFDAALLRLTNDSAVLKSHVDALPPSIVKYIAQDNSVDVKLREKATARAIMLGILPQSEGNKIPEQPFERTVASDVITLVRALGSGKPANSGDSAIIARLSVGSGASIQDNRRVERLLTLMEPFGYNVPNAVWNKLFSYKNRYDGEVPPVLRIERLHDALTANRKGEIILYSALILDATEPARASDLALLPVVRSLKAAGFEKEARDIAYNAVKDYH